MSSLATPARKIEAITPSDSAELNPPARGLFIGVQGNVAVLAEDDTVSVVLVDAVGVLPISVKKVLATNTTATSIVALR